MKGSFETNSASRWHNMATGVLADRLLEKEEARSILHSLDEELLDLLAATYRVRRHFFGNTVQLFFSHECKERALPRGLRILLAVKSV
ncbi:hypothetical protein N9U65_01850 [Planctomycetaceae bacterium]|nr:hypothetical protein [Planctomycetaceae bacterium]